MTSTGVATHSSVIPANAGTHVHGIEPCGGNDAVRRCVRALPGDAVIPANAGTQRAEAETACRMTSTGVATHSPVIPANAGTHVHGIEPCGGTDSSCAASTALLAPSRVASEPCRQVAPAHAHRTGCGLGPGIRRDDGNSRGRRIVPSVTAGTVLRAPSRSRQPDRIASRRQSGYTLIEVIVAFALLALALTLLLGTLSGSARQVRQAADAGQAALYAQSLLDEAGVGVSLQQGQRDGEFDGGRYRWTLDVSPYVDNDRPPSPLVDPAAAQLLLLSLAVEWGDAGPAQRMRLQSLRLVAPDITAAPP